MRLAIPAFKDPREIRASQENPAPQDPLDLRDPRVRMELLDLLASAVTLDPRDRWACRAWLARPAGSVTAASPELRVRWAPRA